MRDIPFSDVKSLIGQELGKSDWHVITQDQVNRFADATGDQQWIHVDVARATAAMGGTIAHGFLTLSLLPMLAASIYRISGVTRGINYGLNKLRFTNMAPTGSRVRLSEKLLAVEDKAGGGLQLTRECAVEIDGKDRPALVCEWITIVYP
jgi:acyl dehydratase